MNNFSYMTDREFSEGRKYIGASDLPTLAGINDYKTPYDLFAEWTGRKESFKGNKRTAAGHRQEPVILGEYIRKSLTKGLDNALEAAAVPVSDSEYKKAKLAANEFVVSRLWGEKQYDRYHSYTECHGELDKRHVAHADLLDLSGDIPILVEAKNTGQFAADARKRNPYKGYSEDDLSQNGIPIGVFFQTQWQMYCYGITETYVAAQIDGWLINVYGPVKYRKKDVEKLVVLADRFLWHIDKDLPPTPKTWPDVVSIFPTLEKSTKSVISGQDELDARAMLSQLAKISRHEKSLAKRKLDINMALALMACEPDNKIMHNYLTTANGDKLASFSERKGSRRISLSKMEKEFPELAEQCDGLGLITKGQTSRSIYVAGASTGTVDLFTAITQTEEGKTKRSRKKYNRAEKTELSAFAKSAGIKLEWERYSK